MSYDSVADAYQNVAVPGFLPIATDLVRAVDPLPGERILDLGTGTGLVASLTAPQVGPFGMVIGVDPSIKMLSHVPRDRSIVLIAGQAPELPLSSGSVDAVVANLVLSHLPDLPVAVADTVRLLRPGGRVAATAWAPEVTGDPGGDRPEADRIVAEVKKACSLDVAPPKRSAVPHEEWLQDSDHLCDTLTNAGLQIINLDQRRYQRSVRVADFLCGWGSQSRYLRHTVGEKRWNDFTQRAATALHERFADTISTINDVWIVVARRS
jgi:SAM-dependent methyltransferase